MRGRSEPENFAIIEINCIHQSFSCTFPNNSFLPHQFFFYTEKTCFSSFTFLIPAQVTTYFIVLFIRIYFSHGVGRLTFDVTAQTRRIIQRINNMKMLFYLINKTKCSPYDSVTTELCNPVSVERRMKCVLAPKPSQHAFKQLN